jgi:hypothetical protein
MFWITGGCLCSWKSFVLWLRINTCTAFLLSTKFDFFSTDFFKSFCHQNLDLDPDPGLGLTKTLGSKSGTGFSEKSGSGSGLNEYRYEILILTHVNHFCFQGGYLLSKYSFNPPSFTNIVQKNYPKN